MARGDWFPTFSGRRLYINDPDPEQIVLIDVAHHLGTINRWGGAAPHPYYVGQHSDHVSRIVDPGFEVPALFHDGHEYVLNDSIRPVKREFSKEYRRLARLWDKAIAQWLDIDVELFYHPVVKHADDVALATERRDFFPPSYYAAEGDDFEIKKDELTVPPHPIIIVAQPWQVAKRMFVQRCLELRPDLAR